MLRSVGDLGVVGDSSSIILSCDAKRRRVHGEQRIPAGGVFLSFVSPLPSSYPLKQVYSDMTPWTVHGARRSLPPPQQFSNNALPLLVFYRHVEKTGGSSIRAAFAFSSCQYFGFDFQIGTRSRLERFATNWSLYEATPKPPNEEHNSRSRSVACIEAHSPAPDFSAFVALAAEARLWATPSPRVLLMITVRRPDAHYLSFFRWSHRPQMVNERNETSLSYSARFLRWAPPNLQSNILRHSSRAHAAHNWCCGDDQKEGGGCCDSGGEGSRRGFSSPPSANLNAPSWVPKGFESGGAESEFCQGLLSALASFDVVMPTESMTTNGLSVVRRLTGLQLPERHVVVPPTYNARPPPFAFADSEAVHARLRENAPCDWRLHQVAEAWLRNNSVR